MEDKVFLKTEQGGMWETAPHMAFGLFLVVYLVILFASIFIHAFSGLPNAVLVIWLILLTVGLVAFAVYSNKAHNLSASTGFVKRNGVLYLVGLGYAEKPKKAVYSPSGSVAQAATLKYNFEAAKDVQMLEEEVRERRKKAQSYVDVVDSFLNAPEDKENWSMGVFDFVILSNPAIEKETETSVWISYQNGAERATKKIRNVYAGLVEEIKGEKTVNL